MWAGRSANSNAGNEVKIAADNSPAGIAFATPQCGCLLFPGWSQELRFAIGIVGIELRGPVAAGPLSICTPSWGGFVPPLFFSPRIGAG